MDLSSVLARKSLVRRPRRLRSRTRWASVLVATLVSMATAVPVGGEDMAPTDVRRFDEQISALQTELRAYPDQFGGLYVPDDGSLVVVLVTPPGTEVIARAGDFELRDKPLLPVEVRLVEHTEAELNALHDRVRADIDMLSGAGVQIESITTEIERNEVVVGVSSDVNTATEQFADLYLHEPVVAESDPGGELNGCTKNACSPHRGGLRNYLTGTDGREWECTAGFIGYQLRESGPRDIQLIGSGHCWHLGERIYHNGTYIGAVKQKVFSGHVDASRIDISDASSAYVASVLRSPDSSVPVRSVQAPDTDYRGQTVCKAGIKTGYRCGHLKNLNVSLRFGGTVLTWLRDVDIPSGSGDSGGPWFSYRSDSAVRANGIHLGVHYPNGVTRSVYSHIWYVTRALGSTYVQLS